MFAKKVSKFDERHKCTYSRSSGTSLVFQWLRHHTPNAGGPGSIPSQGTRSHMPQLRPNAAKWINKYFKKSPKSVEW